MVNKSIRNKIRSAPVFAHPALAGWPSAHTCRCPAVGGDPTAQLSIQHHGTRFYYSLLHISESTHSAGATVALKIVGHFFYTINAILYNAKI